MFASSVPAPTTERYRVWASANGRPTMATLQRRSGRRWSALLAEAGGRPGRRGAVARRP